MTVIHVPKPPKSAHDPERPINTLLRNQTAHLQHAERRLPLRYRSQIYVHAIKTEGEAARYIRAVTEAIHQAHADAVRERAKRTRTLKRAVAVGAAADERTPQKNAMARSTAKKNTGKRKRKK